MISEVIEANYEAKVNKPKYSKPGLRVTSISPCEYETYVNYHKLDEQKFSANGMMRMENGNYQETEILKQIWAAGIKTRYTGGSQMTVTVGKSKIPGHPDGLITIAGKEDLLEIKAMAGQRFGSFSHTGLEKFPRYRCQVQCYMASNELNELLDNCKFVSKHKDSCTLKDIDEPKDLTYSRPIIEMADEIALAGYEPEKRLNPLCTTCYHTKFCWNSPVIDLSTFKQVDLPEAADMWRIGKSRKMAGEELIEQARAVFEKELGSDKVMVSSGLKVSRIDFSKGQISKTKFVEVFGSARLPEVWEETDVSQIRIHDMEG